MSLQFDEQKFSVYLKQQFSDVDIQNLQNDFSKFGFVKIRDIAPQSLKDDLKSEVLRALKINAERRDLILATTGNTPRHLSLVRSELIQESSEFIVSVGNSESLLGFLAQVARETLYPATDDEKYIITRQEKPGDTHGWHWGDFSFALIWILETPPIEYGGMLQCVPHTSWDKDNPRVNEILCQNSIDTYGFVNGDVYFLRTDTTLHRTVPLNREATRIMLNLTWASSKEASHNLVGDDRWFENPNVSAAVTTN